ncbi:dTDP-4-dehydrorhamnose 3,5-epimerase [Henriciella mobilis]|uniref:dTDP-4-dehydrorhamnose 3,5-epimerase n=1 Tax=Henriciella mobilis TaxID=2305467 RepID=UPI000E665DF0|nr:dTDP-4-dehydrorhamnose 3,5-epimerase [Henriciella mobilis]RIJ25649.1 dTDP-4-dehydrorhamnose 3,5-epimerase [Henriciella mobilis]
MIQSLAISDVKLITPKRFGDARGFFSETWNSKLLRDEGIDLEFVQDNHSYSAARGVLRGLHFQNLPHAQDKLVRCTRGRVYDVAVDIRRGSPTFGQYVGAELSAENWAQILVPKGFAHGFVTLEDHCELQYKVTDYYAPECDMSIRWNDPAIGIDWMIDPSVVTLSEKDASAPLLSEVECGFVYKSAHAGSGQG